MDSQPDAWLPPYPYEFIGTSGPVGDFNGDGFDDLFRYSIGDSCQIYFGGNPPDTLPDWSRHRPPAQLQEAGPSGGIGDLDGDGYDDWISRTNWQGGLLFAYMGGADPDTVPAFTIPLTPGSRCRLVNDLNGDGRAEVITSYDSYQANVHLAGVLWQARPTPN